MTHNPYAVTKRKPLTDKQKLKMFLDAGGICCVCGQKINGVKEAWDEHVLPLAVGGSNDADNRAPAHEKCAREKSAAETTLRKKAERVAEKHLGARSRKARPLPGTKASGWKKKISGEVVRR